MESKEGILALFAHLRQDSVIVSEGQNLDVGELIGQVGNSGNTIQPHLHFQLMKDYDLSRAIPVQFVFRAYQVSNNGAWEPLSSKFPSNFEKFRI